MSEEPPQKKTKRIITPFEGADSTREALDVALGILDKCHVELIQCSNCNYIAYADADDFTFYNCVDCYSTLCSECFDEEIREEEEEVIVKCNSCAKK